MIPRLGPTSGYLPKGIHAASWSEFVAAFDFSPARKELLEGFLRAAQELRTHGVSELYVGGSFVSKRMNPKDYDCCFDDTNLDQSNVDPVLIDYSDERAAMKKKYGGEFFPAGAIAQFDPTEVYQEFFQHDKNGRKKGLVLLDLKSMP